MLLHSVTAAHSSVLLNQFCYRISGNLDVGAFRRAWQQLVDRHAMLRTAFLWEDLAEPLQVVRQTVDLPFVELDWSGLAEVEQQNRLEELRAADLERGFAPDRAPLMRCTVARLAPDAHVWVWTSHHLLFDRWCLPIVIDELQTIYESEARGRAVYLPRPRPFRDYIEWIEKQDRARGLAFWARTLQDIEDPSVATALGTSSPHGEGEAVPAGPASDGEIALSAGQTRALRAFARRHGLTVSTLFHGAWALVMRRQTRRTDVVFGTAVSGRPPDLPGVESMIGSFINNVPVRVRMRGDESVVKWLRALMAHQQERVPFEYMAVTDIHGVTAMPPASPLFDSVLVWLAPVGSDGPTALTLEPLGGGVTTAHPITVAIADEAEGIRVQVRSTLPAGASWTPALLADRLGQTLRNLVAGDQARIADLEGQTDAASPVTQTARHTGRVTLAACAIAARRPPGAAHTAGREADDRDLLEAIVRAEWQAVLDSPEIGAHDNFFDVGGNSLLAAQLHARVETAAGRTVPILALFQDATLEGMVATLSGRDWPLQGRAVRPIRLHGSRPPLLCIASPEVNTLGYVMLARHLPSDQPVYVLQLPPEVNRMAVLPPTDMAAHAARYIEALESGLYEEPFRLLGMCGGAHLALAMARQLHDEGRTVDFVGVVNTWTPYTLTQLYRLYAARGYALYYVNRLRDLLRLSPRAQWAELQAKLRRRRAARERRIAHADVGAAPAAGGAPAAAQPYVLSPWEHIGPPPHPLPPRYPGTVTVFRIDRQQHYRVRDPQLGWGDWAARVELCHLPAREHLAIMREPGVTQLAQELNARLEGLPAARSLATSP